MRRGILPVVGGHISQVDFPPCELKPIKIGPSPAKFRRRVVGRTIAEIDRIGKRVVLRLDTRDAIVFEPRMTGLVLISAPPNRTHLRLGLGLTNCTVDQLWFWDRRGLGSVGLFTESELAEAFGPDRLGPDALRIDLQQLKAQLRSSRRDIKVALLDQKCIAGVGNLYASEILHLAGIHPQKKCHLISDSMWQELHQALRQVLRKAIRYEGSTLADGTYRNALNKDGSYQNHHRVYMRAGEFCPRCHTARIQRIVQAQRSTFYCGHCQTKRPHR